MTPNDSQLPAAIDYTGSSLQLARTTPTPPSLPHGVPAGEDELLLLDAREPGLDDYEIGSLGVCVLLTVPAPGLLPPSSETVRSISTMESEPPKDAGDAEVPLAFRVLLHRLHRRTHHTSTCNDKVRVSEIVRAAAKACHPGRLT